MPASRGMTPNWHPTPDFTRSVDEAREMSQTVYVPQNASAFARFLVKSIMLPELEPYEHDKIGLTSVAEDIADRVWQPGIDADTLVELYVRGDEITAEPQTIRTVYVATSTSESGQVTVFSKTRASSVIPT